MPLVTRSKWAPLSALGDWVPIAEQDVAFSITALAANKRALVLADENAALGSTDATLRAREGRTPVAAAVRVAFAGANQISHALIDAHEVALMDTFRGPAQPSLALHAVAAGLYWTPSSASIDADTGAKAIGDALALGRHALVIASTLIELTDGIAGAGFGRTPPKAARFDLCAAPNLAVHAFTLVREALVLAGRLAFAAPILAEGAVLAGHRAAPARASHIVQFTSADQRPQAACFSRLAGGEARGRIGIRIGIGTGIRVGIGAGVGIGGGSISAHAPANADIGAVFTRCAIGWFETDILRVTPGALGAAQVVEAHQLASITDPDLTVGTRPRVCAARVGLPARCTLSTGAHVSTAALLAAPWIRCRSVQDWNHGRAAGVQDRRDIRVP